MPADGRASAFLMGVAVGVVDGTVVDGTAVQGKVKMGCSSTRRHHHSPHRASRPYRGPTNRAPGTRHRRAAAVVPLNGGDVVLVQQGVWPAHWQEEDHQRPPCAEHALAGQQVQQVGFLHKLERRSKEETDQCGQSAAHAAMNTYTPAVPVAQLFVVLRILLLLYPKPA